MTVATIKRLAYARRALDNGQAVELREQLGLSQSEVAAALGIQQSTVWRWEHHQRTPHGDLGARYGQLLEQLAITAALS